MGKFLLGVVVIAVVAVLVYRHRQGAGGAPRRGRNVAGKKIATGSNSSEAPGEVAGKPYAAVSIKTRLGACNAAITAQDKVFLSTAAPPLPLPECDVEDCACRYVFYDDRRQEDRRSPFGANYGAQNQDGERRAGEDRRKA